MPRFVDPIFSLFGIVYRIEHLLTSFGPVWMILFLTQLDIKAYENNGLRQLVV